MERKSPMATATESRPFFRTSTADVPTDAPSPPDLRPSDAIRVEVKLRNLDAREAARAAAEALRRHGIEITDDGLRELERVMSEVIARAAAAEKVESRVGRILPVALDRAGRILRRALDRG